MVSHRAVCRKHRRSVTSSPALLAAMVCTPVTGPGGTYVLLADPSGNLVELFES